MNIIIKFKKKFILNNIQFSCIAHTKSITAIVQSRHGQILEQDLSRIDEHYNYAE